MAPGQKANVAFPCFSYRFNHVGIHEIRPRCWKFPGGTWEVFKGVNFGALRALYIYLAQLYLDVPRTGSKTNVCYLPCNKNRSRSATRSTISVEVSHKAVERHLVQDGMEE